jgi:DNA-binding ferritin-like protein (Dps family)
MIHPTQKDFIEKKMDRREKKRTDKRSTTANEVIFIFEKILEDWKTIKIFNTIIQTNPNSQTDKKSVEKIATGNCKVYESELSKERYSYYQELREKVYEYNKKTS